MMKYAACRAEFRAAADSRTGRSEKNASLACGKCGNSAGSSSWNSLSAARIATSGAVEVFGWLPSAMWLTRRARASSERTRTMRSGDWLKAVGPYLTRSYIAWTCSSETGSSVKVLAVRASRKRRSWAAGSRTRGILHYLPGEWGSSDTATVTDG